MPFSKSSKFSVESAYWGARAASLAYADPEKIELMTRSWGFDDVRFLSASATQCYIAWSDACAVVAFRGTQPTCVRDLVADLDAAKVPAPWGEGKVHRGFLEYAQRAWEFLLDVASRKIGTDKPIFFDGHSLGAAASAMTAMDFATKGFNVAGAYTYGSPRWCDAKCAKEYNKRLGPVTHRSKNNNDAITLVPFSWPTPVSALVSWYTGLPAIPGGFRHVGTLRYLDAIGGLYEAPPLWFRVLDGLDGRVRDIGKLGTDGLTDHFLSKYTMRYQRLLER